MTPDDATLHADVVRALTRWTAPGPAQDALRADYLDHLARHADGVWRACAPGHVTASAAVLDASGARILLTLHRKLKMWLQLGGHLEPGDATLTDAALREATEESGIPGLRADPSPVLLDRHAVPCHPGGSWHLDVQFAVFAPPDAVPVISDESDDLRWFPLDALPPDTDDSVRRLASAARERHTAPLAHD
ncbi:NUDIX hydrolase [Actinomadura flavalba]|uniref:NUDIX hydrolase n=1 Tax=Actinomadura flavalba TaxID=1120938 RepID=UPI0003752475|nr:NUDIX hydrolase [Actinomadura flavalba]